MEEEPNRSSPSFAPFSPANIIIQTFNMPLSPQRSRSKQSINKYPKLSPKLASHDPPNHIPSSSPSRPSSNIPISNTSTDNLNSTQTQKSIQKKRIRSEKLRARLKDAISTKNETLILHFHRGFRSGKIDLDLDCLYLLAGWLRTKGYDTHLQILEKSIENYIYNQKLMNQTHNQKGVDATAMDISQSMPSSPVQEPTAESQSEGEIRENRPSNNEAGAEIRPLSRQSKVEPLVIQESSLRANRELTTKSPNPPDAVNRREERVNARSDHQDLSILEDDPDPKDCPGMAKDLVGFLRDSLNRYFVKINQDARWRTFIQGRLMTSQLTVKVIVPIAVSNQDGNFFEEVCIPMTRHERFENEAHAKLRAENLVAEKIHIKLRSLSDKILAASHMRLDRDLDMRIQEWLEAENTTGKDRRRIHSRLSKVISDDLIPELYGSRVFLYGSMTQGLSCAASDIDIAINIPSEEYSTDQEKRRRQYKILRFICDRITKHEIHNAHVIDAKIPVLRCVDRSGLDLDITVCNAESVDMSRFLRAHLANRQVWEVAITVKHWAKRRQVVGVNGGYINSLGWTLMVIYFLQHHIRPRVGHLLRLEGYKIQEYKWQREKTGRRKTTAELLSEFFYCYGYLFNFSEEAISATTQERMRMTDISNVTKGQIDIFIEHPLMEGVNVVSHVSRASLNTTMEQLREAYGICVRDGNINTLLRRRERRMEERLFERIIHYAHVYDAFAMILKTNV